MHPAAGTYKNPFKMIKDGLLSDEDTTETVLPVPRHSDIVIVGGGAIGLSIAYFLKNYSPRANHITVIERDPTVSFIKCSL